MPLSFPQRLSLPPGRRAHGEAGDVDGHFLSGDRAGLAAACADPGLLLLGISVDGGPSCVGGSVHSSVGVLGYLHLPTEDAGEATCPRG